MVEYPFFKNKLQNETEAGNGTWQNRHVKELEKEKLKA